MNDKELNEIFNEWEQFLSWCYENNDKTIEIHRDNAKYVMDYTRKLQSNWNNLREWLKNSTCKDAFMYDFIAIKVSEILDKMNELEGVDNENN